MGHIFFKPGPFLIGSNSLYLTLRFLNSVQFVTLAVAMDFLFICFGKVIPNVTISKGIKCVTGGTLGRYGNMICIPKVSNLIDIGFKIRSCYEILF